MHFSKMSALFPFCRCGKGWPCGKCLAWTKQLVKEVWGNRAAVCRTEKDRSGSCISSSRDPTELLPYPLSHMERETWPTSSHHLSADFRLKVEDRRIPHEIISKSSSLWMTNSILGSPGFFQVLLFSALMFCIASSTNNLPVSFCYPLYQCCNDQEADWTALLF